MTTVGAAGEWDQEIQRNLSACELEMLALEVRYGMSFREFDRQLEAGLLGDGFRWPLETDAMRWQDLIEEKRHWLSQLRDVSALNAGGEEIIGGSRNRAIQ